MFAPFVQGFLLVGVIYWYTKGMMTVINDYYRGEFKDYLDKDHKKELLLKDKLQVGDGDAPAKKNIDSSPRVEGLPDVLNSEGSIQCRGGIASRGVDSPTAAVADATEHPAIPSPRSLNKEDDKNSCDKLQQIEKCPSQDEQVTSASSFPEDGAATSSNSDSRQLLDSRECNLEFPSHSGDDGTRPSVEPILNPSAGSKSNCEQIVNQQVPIIIDDACKLESTTTAPATTNTVAFATTGTATIFRRDKEMNGIEPGNYPGNVGCSRRVKSFSGSTISNTDDGATKLKTIPTGLSNTLQVDQLRLRVCRRKSVNEMIQFWSNFDHGLQND